MIAEILQILRDASTLASGRLDFRSILDILAVAFILFWILRWLRGTTGMAVLRGALLLLIAAFVFGYVLQLTMFNWLLRNSLPAMLFALALIFHPELRRLLERVGRPLWSGQGAGSVDQTVDILCDAVRRLSEAKIGALIVVARETGLKDYIDTGTPVDGVLTPGLLMTIFTPGSPLHDGAAVVHDGRVVAAGCLLPLATGPNISKTHGTRHRAAIGLTEQTDAVVVVVSEESSAVSLSNAGKIVRILDPINLRVQLRVLLGPSPENVRARFFSDRSSNGRGRRAAGSPPPAPPHSQVPAEERVG
jgi:diadenylate cyclase